jgi:DNA-binding MarR family transcriptional regulator
MDRADVVRAVTKVIIAVFRINGRLLRAGDDLVQPLGLTGARWQMLGAVAKSERPLAAPQLADAMGVTRQGAQKQLDLLVESGLLEQRPNPDHVRSPVYALTTRGREKYQATMQLQRAWAARLTRGLTQGELEAAARVLLALECALQDDHRGDSP